MCWCHWQGDRTCWCPGLSSPCCDPCHHRRCCCFWMCRGGCCCCCCYAGCRHNLRRTSTSASPPLFGGALAAGSERCASWRRGASVAGARVLMGVLLPLPLRRLKSCCCQLVRHGALMPLRMLRHILFLVYETMRGPEIDGESCMHHMQQQQQQQSVHDRTPSVLIGAHLEGCAETHSVSSTRSYDCEEASNASVQL